MAVSAADGMWIALMRADAAIVAIVAAVRICWCKTLLGVAGSACSCDSLPLLLLAAPARLPLLLELRKT